MQNEISDKQREANRQNAQHSTGPRTPEGKARTRLNAGRHGFTGQVAIMSEDDRKAYDDYLRIIVKDLKPEGAVERQLAFSIAEDNYRLNRMRAIEHNLFSFGPMSNLINLDSDDPRIDHVTRQTMAFVNDPKRFGLLSLYIQRTNRAIERNMAQLKERQAERQAALDLELEMASRSQTTATDASTAQSQGADGTASTDSGETPAVANATGHGFVFSPDQIERHRLRVEAKKSLQLAHTRPSATQNNPKGPMKLAA